MDAWEPIHAADLVFDAAVPLEANLAALDGLLAKL
jgi:hypothetical protein